MKITEILELIKKDKTCVFKAPCGVPRLKNGDILPVDLREFYEACGGIKMFAGKPFSFSVLSPQEVMLANPKIVGELCDDDISARWYVLCEDANGNFISFDASSERNGRCYDSFLEVHGVAGSCAIVARNFTELLVNLFNEKGESLFWLDENFECIGDAYDEF